MDVYILSTVGECSNYMPKQDGAVSVVISPLRLEGKEGNLKVISGCNMWQGCKNPNCHFSSAGREKPKVKAKT